MLLATNFKRTKKEFSTNKKGKRSFFLFFAYVKIVSLNKFIVLRFSVERVFL